jgi:peptidoglycan/xylan/chitin deacetylase (PgdA/CDA1 family)
MDAELLWINFLSAELHSTFVEEVARRGHEIAHHGYSHTNHAVLDYDSEEAEFRTGLDALKNIGGTVVRGFRLPAGDMSDNTRSFIRKFGSCTILACLTMMFRTFRWWRLLSYCGASSSSGA